MDMEIKKLMKLKVAEQNLAALLQKIDTEINQTDIQWMHLKSLVPTKQDVASKAESSTQPHVLKMRHHIDDQSVNETKLNLSLEKAQAQGSISEEESD